MARIEKFSNGQFDPAQFKTKQFHPGRFNPGSKLDQTCPNRIKLVQIGLDISKLDQTCPNWIESVQIGSNLSKVDQTCQNWTGHVQIGSNLSKWIGLVQFGSNLSKFDQTCQNWMEPVQIGSMLSKLDQTCPNGINTIYVTTSTPSNSLHPHSWTKVHLVLFNKYSHFHGKKEKANFFTNIQEINFRLFPMEMTVPIKKVRAFFFLKGVWGRKVIGVIFQLKPYF